MVCMSYGVEVLSLQAWQLALSFDDALELVGTGKEVLGLAVSIVIY